VKKYYQKKENERKKKKKRRKEAEALDENHPNGTAKLEEAVNNMEVA